MTQEISAFRSYFEQVESNQINKQTNKQQILGNIKAVLVALSEKKEASLQLGDKNVTLKEFDDQTLKVFTKAISSFVKETSLSETDADQLISQLNKSKLGKSDHFIHQQIRLHEEKDIPDVSPLAKQGVIQLDELLADKKQSLEKAIKTTESEKKTEEKKAAIKIVCGVALLAIGIPLFAGSMAAAFIFIPATLTGLIILVAEVGTLLGIGFTSGGVALIINADPDDSVNSKIAECRSKEVECENEIELLYQLKAFYRDPEFLNFIQSKKDTYQSLFKNEKIDNREFFNDFHDLYKKETAFEKERGSIMIKLKELSDNTFSGVTKFLSCEKSIRDAWMTMYNKENEIKQLQNKLVMDSDERRQLYTEDLIQEMIDKDEGFTAFKKDKSIQEGGIGNQIEVYFLYLAQKNYPLMLEANHEEAEAMPRGGTVISEKLKNAEELKNKQIALDNFRIQKNQIAQELFSGKPFKVEGGPDAKI